MASCSTERWTYTAPYVTLTVTERVDSAISHQATLDWTLTYYSSSAAETSVAKDYSVTIAGETVKTGKYDINGRVGTHTIATGTKVINKTTQEQNISFGVSFGFYLEWAGVTRYTMTASGSITIGAKATYTISYNANGGSGAPSAQSKWHGDTITISEKVPSRTGHTFKGWATSSSGSVAYSPEANYTNNASVTLYAVWQANTYTITYNANGGTGAPPNDIKTYGVTLTLSTTIPERTNYKFLGWSTSSTASTATYAAGGSFTLNQATTLYAVWELSYIRPKIDNIKVERSGSSAIVTYDFTCFVSPSTHIVTFTNEKGETITASTNHDTASVTGATITVGANLSTDYTYTFTLVISDAYGSSKAVCTLPSAAFPLDFKMPGTGAAMGKTAELQGVFDVAFKIRSKGGYLYNVLDAGTDLNALLTPNNYIGLYIAANDPYVASYVNIPTGLTGTFTLEILSGGESGQTIQRITQCDRTKPQEFVRIYHGDGYGNWSWGKWLRRHPVTLFNGSSNSTITLSESVANFEVIDIFFTDNNGLAGGSIRVSNANGKIACLSVIEAANSGTTLIRRTHYTISGTQLTPATSTAGYVSFSGTGFNSPSIGTNYIKIVRVLGYDAGAVM